MSSRLRVLGNRIRRHAPELPVVFYAHPFELALGFVLTLGGIRAVITGGDITPAVNLLPSPVLYVFAAVSFGAGIGILLGLATRRKTFGRAIERGACWLAAGNYIGYGYIIADRFPLSDSWATVTTTLGIGLACVLRAKAIRKTELAILRALQAANTAEDDAQDLIRRLVDSRAINPDREGRS